MSEEEKIQEEEIPLTKQKREIIVDLWRTNLHGEELGIRQKEQYRAKSRGFTKHTELFGKVTEKVKGKEEDLGYLGYQKDEWDDTKEKLERRLTIKLFSKSMYHQGTLEEMVGREFSHSLSAKHDYPSFNLMIDDYEYLIKLSKNRGGLLVSECFNFSVEDEEGFIPIILKHKMGLGIDFRVINGFGNKQFGFINGHKFDVGGRYDITLKATDERLLDNVIARALILFAGSLKFHKEIHKKIKKGSKKIKKGKWVPPLTNKELDLERNPRSILHK